MNGIVRIKNSRLVSLTGISQFDIRGFIVICYIRHYNINHEYKKIHNRPIKNRLKKMEAWTGLEPVSEVLQTPCLTTWLPRLVKHFRFYAASSNFFGGCSWNPTIDSQLNFENLRSACLKSLGTFEKTTACNLYIPTKSKIFNLVSEI